MALLDSALGFLKLRAILSELSQNFIKVQVDLKNGILYEIKIFEQINLTIITIHLYAELHPLQFQVQL